MPERTQHKVGQFMNGLVKRNPGEPEFHQAVREVTESLMPIILEHPEYQKAQILCAHDGTGSHHHLSSHLGGRRGLLQSKPGVEGAV